MGARGFPCAHNKGEYMNVSAYLKSIGKTKRELAVDIKLSRPTLDQYIKVYESGERIDNERYQIIFERLFRDTTMGREEFDRVILSIKLLLERDKKYDIGEISTLAADIVVRIHNIMVNDMESDNWNKRFYDGLLVVLANYHKVDIMREVIEYFSDLNSDFDLSCLSEESKAYRAYFYNCFRAIVDKAPNYNEELYNQFLLRKEELKAGRKKAREVINNSIKDRFQNILEEVQQESINKGVEISENEIMAEVVRRIQN